MYCTADSPYVCGAATRSRTSDALGSDMLTAAGVKVWPRCTLAYAPPEVVAAVHADTHVRVSAKQDIWALGVIGYEAVVQRTALTSTQALLECALGGASYPWEAPDEEQPAAWLASPLRPLLTPCLRRAAATRPRAAALLTSMTSASGPRRTGSDPHSG